MTSELKPPSAPALAPVPIYLDVAVDVPLQALPADFDVSQGVDYVWKPKPETDEIQPQRGSVVVVRWAGRVCLGVVLNILDTPRFDAAKVQPAYLLPALAGAALPEGVLKLALFASQYYHRGIGEVLLPTVAAALPAPKRPSVAAAFEHAKRSAHNAIQDAAHRSATNLPTLNAQQAAVLAALSGRQFKPHLLYGVTGSGKTEVYLARAAQALAAGKQVLILVPEIVLVPAMLARVKRALPHARATALHSDIGVATRRRAWAACLAGAVDVVVGTRLAVFAPLPALGLIVVDEEHDPSYKQQEGVRYCARNLAIVRARFEGCPVVLGSATPSLESWLQAQNTNNAPARYTLHRMTQRARAESQLPDIVTINLGDYPATNGISAPALEALTDTLARGEQSLVFLNRRGYAPVLGCNACGWVSDCAHCASHMALHRLKSSWRLLCHHCGSHAAPPRACPDCGNAQIEPEGQGTQQLEQTLASLLAAVPNKSGQPPVIARLDSDVTRKVGVGGAITAAMHAGEVDVLVGTQMTAKGHDFANLSTVLVAGCDGALFSPDYRGVERLFALLMQVSGRAGRAGVAGTVWIQTRQAAHPLFTALTQPSIDGFYAAMLAERKRAGLPPYGYQAVLRAAHPEQSHTLDWLAAAKRLLDLSVHANHAQVSVFAPVPMLMPKLAGKHRSQLLFESPSRAALHALLSAAVPAWVQFGKAARAGELGYGLNWWLEVDPGDV